MPDEDFDPRVHLIDTATGERTKIRRDVIAGLDDFISSVVVNTDLPEESRFRGWQQSDEEHPSGAGRAAYRVVYKTIRTAPTQPAVLIASNCRVMFVNGQVTWGEPRFGRALPWRRPDRFLVPDWGRVYYAPLRYIRAHDNEVALEAHQETSPPMSYVEVVYVLDTLATHGDHHDRLTFARAGVAPLLASLDLTFGPRLLGIRITEELGEVFDDWHWNRRLDGPSVALEAQAELRYVNADDAIAQFTSIFNANEGRSTEDRARIRIAAQWYWRADAETDPVQAFIAHWLTIEALEMDNANIAPVKRVVQGILGGDPSSVALAVGRLHGLRSRLVHGKLRTVTSAQLDAVRAVACALLEQRLLGILSETRRAALQTAVSTAQSNGFHEAR